VEVAPVARNWCNRDFSPTEHEVWKTPSRSLDE
jgi:hypothetical protein